jgi:hypothetical protein
LLLLPEDSRLRFRAEPVLRGLEEQEEADCFD